MRYLIKFTKETDIKFISHLDVMRTIQKIFRRSELPVQHSQGFNPHINMSIAQPLSVGTYSKGEYMDVEFEKEVNEAECLEKFNSSSPDGIKALKVVRVRENVEGQKKVPQAMAVVEAAEYNITIKYEDTSKINDELNELLKSNEWVTIKKSKTSEKSVNIRGMVKKMNYKIEGNALNINTIISCGSVENLSADLFSKYIKENTSNVKVDSFVDVERVEMYSYKNKKMIPLYEALS